MTSSYTIFRAIDLTLKSLNNTKDSTMENKKQSQKQVKTLPLTTLPVVKLDEKDMSSLSGGGGTWGG
jgi:hypothetical protein